jgi:hypothetical protein
MTGGPALHFLGGMNYRVKVIPPCGDCNYFYADSYAAARQMQKELIEDMREVAGTRVFVYVETRYGHIRVDE